MEKVVNEDLKGAWCFRVLNISSTNFETVQSDSKCQVPSPLIPEVIYLRYSKLAYKIITHFWPKISDVKNLIPELLPQIQWLMESCKA